MKKSKKWIWGLLVLIVLLGALTVAAVQMAKIAKENMGVTEIHVVEDGNPLDADQYQYIVRIESVDVKEMAVSATGMERLKFGSQN